MTTGELIQEIASGRQSASVLASRGLDVLPDLLTLLSEDLPIEETENLERVLKSVLFPFLSRGHDLAVATQLAEFQRSLGFLLKYKSYAVKATSILGFSVFLQNVGEGFSFQQHIDHKVEVFHILHVKDGGYVFICDKKEWDRVFDPDSFAQWLHGKPDTRYEQFRHRPIPGDIIVINRLNVVHTVFGCILEEYATVSTDMVNRLFDQNKGRPVPVASRVQIAQQLASLPIVDALAEVQRGPDGWTRSSLTAKIGTGPRAYSIASIDRLAATRHVLPAGTETAPFVEPAAHASSLFVAAGRGTLRLGGTGGSRSVPLRAGELALVAGGATYQLINEDAVPLVVSEQQIPVETALVGTERV